MLSNKKSEALLAKIRENQPLVGREKLNLIVELSIPSMLAQITSVMMFFIDASMVGHLGAGQHRTCRDHHVAHGVCNECRLHRFLGTGGPFYWCQ